MAEEIDELFQKGEAIIATSDWERAFTLFEFILGRCEVRDDPLRAAFARRRLGDIETQRGRFTEAGVHYMKALETLLPSKALDETAKCLRGLGYLHWRKGDYNMATEYLEQGLERALKAGNKEVQGCILVDMGNVSVSIGRFDAGERLFNQAIAVLEGVQGNYDVNRALMNLGDMYMTTGDMAKASEYFQKAIVSSKNSKDEGNLSWALMNLAECMVNQGELRKVPDLLDDARVHLASGDDRIGLAATKRVMGQWATANGDWALAEREFESALADYEEFDMPERRGVVLRLYGQMLAKKGDMARGRTMLQMAVDIFQDIGNLKELERTRALLMDMRDG